MDIKLSVLLSWKKATPFRYSLFCGRSRTNGKYFKIFFFLTIKILFICEWRSFEMENFPCGNLLFLFCLLKGKTITLNGKNTIEWTNIMMHLIHRIKYVWEWFNVYRDVYGFIRMNFHAYVGRNFHCKYVFKSHRLDCNH